MFGRTKATTTVGATNSAADAAKKAAGKGRPTPKRREVERRNRHPVVGASRLSPGTRPGATKQERKAARKAQRVINNQARARSRQGLLSGNEDDLPARDRGPARRFVRDYVDARRNLSEYFIPVAIVMLVLSVVRSVEIRMIATLVLYAFFLVVVADCTLLRRRLNRIVAERFNADRVPGTSGAGTYGMLRALQIRRSRLPRPRVGRGQFPS